jgi:hypothetical protein
MFRKRVLNISGFFILIFSLAFFEISFIPLCSGPFKYLNLSLPVIFFISIILDHNLSLWVGFLEGIVLSLFSTYPFGSIVFSLIISLMIINFLLNNFFTNRSLYSLIVLGFLGNFIYVFILGFIKFIFFLFGIGMANINEFSSLFSINNIFWSSVFNILFLTLLFYAHSFWGKQARAISL